eukprot:12400534-Karenia_brevis.AAC.1
MSWNRNSYNNWAQNYNHKHSSPPPRGWYAGMGWNTNYNKQQRALQNALGSAMAQALAGHGL